VTSSAVPICIAGAASDISLNTNRTRAPVDGELTRPETPLLEGAGDERLGTLILLPYPDLESSIHLDSCALFLESRRDDDAFARLRKDEVEEALASSPVNPREINHVRSWLDQQRGIAQLLHEALGLIAPLRAFALGDRCRRVRPSRLERGQLGGDLWLGFGRRSGGSLGRSQAEKCRSSGECRAALNELSALHMISLVGCVMEKRQGRALR